MPPQRLALLSIAVLTLIVFAFFVVQLMPVKPPALAPGIEAGSVETPTVTFVNPTRGATNAKVTIIEYADFQCPACKDVGAAIEVALTTFPNEVRHVWKDMPNESAHPLSTKAAIAAHCAQEHGKFWEYHDALYTRQTYLAEDEFGKIAVELALNETAFKRCYDSRDTLPVVKRDFDEGTGLGIVSTPTIFLNNEPIVGAITAEELISRIRAALATEPK